MQTVTEKAVDVKRIKEIETAIQDHYKDTNIGFTGPITDEKTGLPRYELRLTTCVKDPVEKTPIPGIMDQQGGQFQMRTDEYDGVHYEMLLPPYISPWRNATSGRLLALFLFLLGIFQLARVLWTWSAWDVAKVSFTLKLGTAFICFFVGVLVLLVDHYRQKWKQH